MIPLKYLRKQINQDLKNNILFVNKLNYIAFYKMSGAFSTLRFSRII